MLGEQTDCSAHGQTAPALSSCDGCVSWVVYQRAKLLLCLSGPLLIQQHPRGLPVVWGSKAVPTGCRITLEPCWATFSTWWHTKVLAVALTISCGLFLLIGLVLGP